MLCVSAAEAELTAVVKTCDLPQLYIRCQTDSQAVTAPSGVLIRLTLPTPVIMNVALKVIRLIA